MTLARGLGVTQLVVAMNKLETNEYNKERYAELKESVWQVLKRLGYKQQDVTFVPISGLHGENLTKRATDERLVSWYGKDSPSLVEVLDKLRPPKRTFKKPIRLSISNYKMMQTGPLIGDCV